LKRLKKSLDPDPREENSRSGKQKSLAPAIHEIRRRKKATPESHPEPADSKVNKSSDAIMNKLKLPHIAGPAAGAGHQRYISKRDVKANDNKSKKSPQQPNTAKSMEDYLKENEKLKQINRELEARIARLEDPKREKKKKEKEGGNSGKSVDKLLFEYERKIGSMELTQRSMNIKLEENDKLITQLLQTIDYLNQGGSHGSKMTQKQLLLKQQQQAQNPEKNQYQSGNPPQKLKESLESPKAAILTPKGQFLFNKSELVQSHTQIQQIKFMIFEGFKTLQGEIVNKYGENGKVMGILDYLLYNLDSLFNIIHQLEIKELQYLNLLTTSAGENGKEEEEKTRLPGVGLSKSGAESGKKEPKRTADKLMK
jgi:hypothetical protein